MFNKIKDYRQFANILAIFILSLIIACMGKGLVNRLANALMPVENVTIEPITEGNDIWIYDDGGENNLFSACRTGEKEGDWEYRDKESYGYASDMIYSYGMQGESKLSFQTKVCQNSYIMFWKSPQSGSVMIAAENRGVQEINLHSDVEGGEMVRVYPFGDRLLPVIVRLAFYAVVFVLCFIILVGLYYCLLWRERKHNWLFNDARRSLFFPVWIFIYIFSAIQYRIGISNFLGFGDQIYYWGKTLFGRGQGWNPSILADELMSFRGYLCNFFPTVAQNIASFIGIDPVYIYFIFTSLALSWLITIVLPELYKTFTSKNANNIQVLLVLPIYLFFWNGTTTAVLADMFGMVAFLSGILFLLQFKKEHHIWQALLAGFFFSMSCNFRTAYQYGLILILFILVCENIIILVKTKDKRKNIKERYLKILCGFITASAAFAVIALPQLQINLERGHAGLLPYDFDEAWEGTSLMEYSANYSIDSSYSGYPISVSDSQLLSLKRTQYENQDFLSIPQILGVYANDPFNTLIVIVKKCFLAFDTKTNVTYPNYPEDIPWNSSSGFVFSFFNYFVLGSALYILFYRHNVSTAERKLTAAFFAGLVLPQMFVHVEWRYFLATYVLLYYLFSYHFVGEIIVSREKCQEFFKTKYLLVISVMIFISFVISLTIFAGALL